MSTNIDEPTSGPNDSDSDTSWDLIVENQMTDKRTHETFSTAGVQDATSESQSVDGVDDGATCEDVAADADELDVDSATENDQPRRDSDDDISDDGNCCRECGQSTTRKYNKRHSQYVSTCSNCVLSFLTPCY